MLSYVAERGDEVILAFILASGNYAADIESKDKNDRTPLWYAVTNRHEAVVQLLLDRGANIARPWGSLAGDVEKSKCRRNASSVTILSVRAA